MTDTHRKTVSLDRLGADIPNAIVGGPFGSNLVSNDYADRGVPVIRGQNVGGGRWVGGEFVFVSDAKAEALRANWARPGDIVFTQRGTLGQVAIVPKGPWDRYVVSQSQMKATIDPSKADPLYVYYFFTNPVEMEYIVANAIQTGVPHTNLTQLRSHPVCVPVLQEQQAVARVLGALDNKIEQNGKTARVLERLSRAIFQSWFIDFEPVKAKAAGATSYTSMPQEVFDSLPARFVDSDIGPVPKGWVLRAIGDVVTAKGGGTPSTENPAYWEGGVYCWATPKDMSRLAHPVLLNTDRRITDAAVDKISSGVLPVGTVLMSSRAPVGYLAITGVPTAINQGFIAMVCEGPLPPTFVFNWALTSMDAIKGRASGTTFPEINKKNFRSLPVVVPTDDVIAAYRATADPLFDLLTACVKENVQSAAVRDYLLPRLMSGSARVRYD
jgi:type I restriction enzyme S subunit